jgi:ribonuclease HII
MIGIDEAGRGAWAGPLVVAGCLFLENPGFIDDLHDSKKLTAKQREALEDKIKSLSIYEIVAVSHSDVDTYGLTTCLRNAIVKILIKLPKDQRIMLDGKYNFLKDTEYADRTSVIIGADSKYFSVMAASILAKVERDRIMKEYAKQFPQYGFDTHVGYGTQKHLESLKKSGACSIHRLSVKPLKALA